MCSPSPVCDWHCAPWTPTPPPIPPPIPPPTSKPTMIPTKVPSPAVVTVPDWSSVTGVARAVPTYLDQVNPGTMARDSPIHDQVFARIKELDADYVRWVDFASVFIKLIPYTDVYWHNLFGL